MAIEVFAPAKVNLALHVMGRRADGYHLLESLVVFADTGDLLSVTPADELALEVTGPRARGVPTDGSNLVLKAAERLRALRGVSAGARITLEKHLPHGGGIGGGSSDAAAALRALAALWRVAPLDPAEALPLGADIPVCLQAPEPAVFRGIGEILEPVPPLPEAWLVLVNPGVAVATGAVFKRLDAVYASAPPGLAPFPEPLADPASFAKWLLGQRNDLTKVVAEILPRTLDILESLGSDEACADCDMSGSGSTCWGLFFDPVAARAAADRIAAAHPKWWVRAARVLGSGRA